MFYDYIRSFSRFGQVRCCYVKKGHKCPHEVYSIALCDHIKGYYVRFCTNW